MYVHVLSPCPVPHKLQGTRLFHHFSFTPTTKKGVVKVCTHLLGLPASLSLCLLSHCLIFFSFFFLFENLHVFYLLFYLFLFFHWNLFIFNHLSPRTRIHTYTRALRHMPLLPKCQLKPFLALHRTSGHQHLDLNPLWKTKTALPQQTSVDP